LGSVGKGVVLVLGLTFAAFVVGGSLLAMGPAAFLGIAILLGIGGVQAAWIVPLWLHFRRTHETETAKGLLIAASIVFLLNAGCWGLVGTIALSSH
jgi:hypothetical protein